MHSQVIVLQQCHRRNLLGEDAGCDCGKHRRRVQASWIGDDHNSRLISRWNQDSNRLISSRVGLLLAPAS